MGETRTAPARRPDLDLRLDLGILHRLRTGAQEGAAAAMVLVELLIGLGTKWQLTRPKEPLIWGLRLGWWKAAPVAERPGPRPEP